jgi:hypothetical protein
MNMFGMKPGWLALLLVAGTALQSSVEASSVRQWRAEGAESFTAGELDGVMVSPDGVLGLAPLTKTIWGPEPGIVWDLALAGDSKVWIALSEPSNVVLAGAASAPVVWYEGKPGELVTALMTDGDGGFLAGLSPGGSVIRVRSQGVREGRIETGSEYVWDLLQGAGKTTWIATGSPGAVLKSVRGGKPETVFETGDDPVRCLALLPDGDLVAGTGLRGRVLRINPETGTAFVLFDTGTEEVVSLAVGPGETIYALTSGKAPKPKSSTQATTDKKNADASKEPVPKVTTRVLPPGTVPHSGGPGKVGGTGGALYRIEPDGDVVRLWSAVKELPYAVTVTAAGKVLVATGLKGRILEVGSSGTAAVVSRIAAGKASHLLERESGELVIAGNSDARVETLGASPSEKGSWKSPPVDAGWIADWGEVQWRGSVESGSSLSIYGRAGNSAEPDSTWTDWLPLASHPGNSVERSNFPAARWFQVRLDLGSQATGGEPAIQQLVVNYRTRNREPRVVDLRVMNPGIAKHRGKVQSSSRYGNLVADDPVARDAAGGKKGNGNGNGRRGPIRRSYEPGVRTFEWDATDPDGDSLMASIEVRSLEGSAWFPLVSDLSDSFYSWDARGLPDGEYVVRLTVDDRKDNPDQQNRSATRMSDRFVLDGTAPRLSLPPAKPGRADRRTVLVQVEDSASGVHGMEVSVDGGDWRPVDPVDGIADSGMEVYRLEFKVQESGSPPHRLMVRAADRAGNLAVKLIELAD